MVKYGGRDDGNERMEEEEECQWLHVESAAKVATTSGTSWVLYRISFQLFCFNYVKPL